MSLCLLHTAGKLNDHTHRPPIRFEGTELQPGNFTMSMVQSIPVHTSYIMSPADLTRSAETSSNDKFRIKWVLQHNYVTGELDWHTQTESNEFNISMY